MNILSYKTIGTAALAAALSFSASAQTISTLSVADSGGSLDALTLANLLVNDSAITVTSATLTGNANAFGTFSGGIPVFGGTFADGVVLSSGDIDNLPGPNTSDGTSTNFPDPGDADLNALIPQSTNDAAVLEFSFTVDPTQAQSGGISFDFVFGSEEYNEYVDQFNDVFAFFLNGTNIATLPGGDPISVNNVNTGDNSVLYRNNDESDLGNPSPINIELDGLTTILSVGGTVNVGAGTSNTIKLAIADAGDSALDSAVFFAGGSFDSTPPDPIIPEPSTIGLVTVAGLFAMAQLRRRLLRK